MHVSSLVAVTQKMFGYCGGLRTVSLFVNGSAMFTDLYFAKIKTAKFQVAKCMHCEIDSLFKILLKSEASHLMEDI